MDISKKKNRDMEQSAVDNLLKDEYFYLHKVIEDLDSKTITIKAWSISGSLVLIGAGLSGKASKELFLVSAIASMFFWIIEANWKGFQQSFYPRIIEIESYFKGDSNIEIVPFQIKESWSVNWKKQYKHKVYTNFLWWPAVMFPHLVLSITGFVLYHLSNKGTIHITECL